MDCIPVPETVACSCTNNLMTDFSVASSHLINRIHVASVHVLALPSVSQCLNTSHFYHCHPVPTPPLFSYSSFSLTLPMSPQSLPIFQLAKPLVRWNLLNL